MALTHLGALTVGGVAPGAVALGVAGLTGINLALPDVQARLSALLAFAPTPVSFAAQLQLAQDTLASVQATIALGLPVPDIGAQIAIVAAQIAALVAAIAAVEAQLALIVDLQSAFGAAGVNAYAYTGTVGGLSGDVATAAPAPGAPGDACNALLLTTTAPAAWVALGRILKVAP